MKKTICLNMIVKDESPVILRCLESVKKWIDYWVIVDTGSSDGTQKIIKDFLKEVPGELHERPWIDFATNRNEALELSKNKADYLLFLDADQWIILDPSVDFASLTKDVYYCPILTENEIYYHELMVAACHHWKWEGVVHEGLISSDAKSSEIFQGIQIVATSEGNRSRMGNKYIQDAFLLRKELEKDPSNARNVFYLGLSLGLSGNYSEALPYYEKRASMGGDPEEVFIALLSVGVVQELLKMDDAIILKSYENAFQFRSSRAEPLFYMARYYLKMDQPFFSYLISKFALTIPYPQDLHFVRFSIYDYELLLQYAESSYAIGRIDETCLAYRKLIEKFEEYLSNKKISEDLKVRINEILPGMKEFLLANDKV